MKYEAANGGARAPALCGGNVLITGLQLVTATLMRRTRHYTELTFSLLNIPDDSVPQLSPAATLSVTEDVHLPHDCVQY